MLPWQQICSSKHFSKSDITSYDNDIGFSSMDIWQIHEKNQEKKTPSHSFLNKMAVLFRFKFEIFPLSVNNLFFFHQ